MIKIKFNRFSLTLIIFLFSLINFNIFSQSPYYSLKLSVNDTPGNNFKYNITAYDVSFSYTPVVPSGDYWFGKDTSVLNWNALPDSLMNSVSIKKISSSAGNKYEYGNQQMVWEHIITFIITRQNTAMNNEEPSPNDTMIIVMPVLLKSFVTFIDVGTIPFKKGYYELLDGFVYDMSQWLKISLREDMNWQTVDFAERKIKFDPSSFPK